VGTSSPDGARHLVRATRWAAALADQLLARHGVLTREAVAAESIPGGFALLYPVLKAMEERGRLRRGYFVAGLGATQFALPGALDLLRSLREPPDAPEVVRMAATDPANPYGAALRFPALAAPAAARQACCAEAAPGAKTGRGPTRSVGATAILVDGALAAYLARGEHVLSTWLPVEEPFRSRSAREVARSLIEHARSGQPPRGMLIEEIDGMPATAHLLAPFLAEAGFLAGALGMQARPIA
jgi:ATP-dependent Lhr-like helicase